VLKSQGGNAVVRAVVLPTACALLLLAVIVGALLHFSTSESDRLAVERQYRLAKIAVAQSMTAIANDQEASTYWDDAVLRQRKNRWCPGEDHYRAPKQLISQPI